MIDYKNCYICKSTINIVGKYCMTCIDIKNQVQNYDNILDRNIDIYSGRIIEIKYMFTKKIHNYNCHNYDMSVLNEHFFTLNYPLLKIFTKEDINENNLINFNSAKNKIKYYEKDVYCDCECDSLNNVYKIIGARIRFV